MRKAWCFLCLLAIRLCVVLGAISTISLSLRQCLADGIRGLGECFAEDMGINVLRSSGVTVTEMLRNDLDRNTHVYQQGCVCVAKVMDMHIGEIVVGKQFFELQIDVAFIHVFSVLSCEHRSPLHHSHSQTGKQTEGSIIDIHKKFTLRPLAKLSHNLAKYVEW